MSILKSTNSGIHGIHITKDFLLKRGYQELISGALSKEGIYNGQKAFYGLYPARYERDNEENCIYKFIISLKGKVYEVLILDFETLLLFEEMISLKKDSDRENLKKQLLNDGKAVAKML